MVPKASISLLMILLGLAIFTFIDILDGYYYGGVYSKWEKNLTSQDEFREKIYNSNFYNDAIPTVLNEEELARIKKSRPNLDQILPPTSTYIGITIEDIFNLDEINDSVFVRGEITANYDKNKGIGPIHLLYGETPENLLDFFEPNFIDLDGAIYEQVSVSDNRIDTNVEVYKFGGRFRANIDHRDFPFDNLVAEVSFSSLAPLLDLNLDFKEVYVDDGRFRLNAFIAKKADCREENEYACGYIHNTV